MSWERTLNAGRGAGRTNASEVVGRTRSGSSPSSSKTARARSNHEQRPDPVACQVPYGAPEYRDLELYLAWRAAGLPVETPGVRR